MPLGSLIGAAPRQKRPFLTRPWPASEKRVDFGVFWRSEPDAGINVGQKAREDVSDCPFVRGTIRHSEGAGTWALERVADADVFGIE
jgi:hypothetical protein